MVKLNRMMVRGVCVCVCVGGLPEKWDSKILFYSFVVLC